MKRNIFVRILAALGGLTLWMLGLGALAETFFRVPITEKLGQLLAAGTPVAVLITLLGVIILAVLGTCCLMMLSGKRAAKRKGFVMQKGENGMIGVSVKSIEGLVQTCVKQHEEVASAEISVVERRDGIVILLNIEEAAGVSIPLAVGALQKQIRQYVNTCTGVDVHEVRVMVENTETNAAESPYAVEKPVVLTTAATAAEMHHGAPAVVEAPVQEAAEPVEEAVSETAPVLETTVMEEAAPAEKSVQENVAVPTVNIPVVPVAPVIPMMPELVEEEDDRPLHQRLFGAEDQPVFVPAPPELVIEPQAEEAPEAVETVEQSAEAESVQEESTEDGMGANAVLEVVEAIAQEEALVEDDDLELAAEETSEYDEDTLAEQASLDGEEAEDEIRESFTQEV